MPFEARHNIQKCMNCSACLEFVACPGAHREICIGCGACTLICPHEAIDLVEVTREKDVCIDVDGVLLSVPEMISVKEALGIIGYQVNDCLPAEEGLYAPCGVGACWNCAVHINGEVRQACVTEAREGMKIRTDIPKQWVPLRIVGPSGGLPHGGVGTPWDVRKNAKSQYLEICCIVAGCNFRCPQCHNWMVTHMGQGRAYTPQEAAAMLTRMREKLQLNRFCLSGGEITLNRVWLVQLLKELRTLNPYPENHLHISTNGSLLTEDYIDELIDAGLNDFGIDL
ncbi:MAG: radical SAM protein, partial [Thermodesulfobacteriota bacterium]|nr:radical SAM protein [Thermodesulfobacteriota bacterium]